MTFLYTYAGAERVLEQMLHVFPEASLFSLFRFSSTGKTRVSAGAHRHLVVHSEACRSLAAGTGITCR